MPNIGDLKESRFVTQQEVDPPVLVTISGWAQTNVAKEGADPEYRYVLKFLEMDKPMTLNSTNGQLIAAITGSEEFDGWKGKKIVLYRDKTISFGGRMCGGIRVRAPKSSYQEPEPPAPTDDDIPF